MQEEAYEMPIVKYLKKDRHREDPIALVKGYLVNQLGEIEARKRLRKMTGLQVLELADALAAGKLRKSRKGVEEPYEMPEIRW